MTLTVKGVIDMQTGLLIGGIVVGILACSIVGIFVADKSLERFFHGAFDVDLDVDMDKLDGEN